MPRRAPRRYLPPLLILAIALPLLWRSLAAAPPLRLDVGEWGDQAVLTGAYDREETPTESYRWTSGRAELSVPNLSGRAQVLRLRAHGGRPPGVAPLIVEIDINEQHWSSFQTTDKLRVYSVLLPNDPASPTIRIGLTTPTYIYGDDPRALGFALDWADLRPLGQAGTPAFPQFAAQALLLALALALVGALALPRGWTLPTATLVALLLVSANLWQPLWVSLAVWPWLTIVGGLLLATPLLRPGLARALSPWMAQRQAGVAWALLAAGLALRLFGASHPLFDTHDLRYHTDWLRDTIAGQVYLYASPAEFHDRMVIYPSGGYVLLAPLRLLLSQRLAVQVGVALADAFACLLLVPMARELGLSARAALLALALAVALPINMTMLWWGFATNALAQPAGLMVILALLRLARRPTRRGWAVFTVACAAGLLFHIGALALLLALIGAALLLGWRRMEPRALWAVVGGVALAAASVGLVYFLAAAGPTLAQPKSGSADSVGELLAKSLAGDGTRLRLVSDGLLNGFLPLPLALAPLGLLALLRGRTRHPLGRALPAAWALVCLAFFCAYMALGLIARYIYFAAPLVCLALGALLDGLWTRRGRLVALALVLLVMWSGAALWAGGVLMRIKPSVTPLTQ